jgi:pimeloyl-ACP methyl ester carboxylesterase
VTLIYGDRSWYQFPDLPEREAALKHSERHTVPGSHSLHIDSPDAVADIFLKALKTAAP